MVEVGLWVQISGREAFLIKKDPNGYPDLFPLDTVPMGRDEKKEKVRGLYKELTGKSYSHTHATTRQLLWDLLEVAIPQLP